MHVNDRMISEGNHHAGEVAGARGVEHQEEHVTARYLIFLGWSQRCKLSRSALCNPLGHARTRDSGTTLPHSGSAWH